MPIQKHNDDGADLLDAKYFSKPDGGLSWLTLTDNVPKMKKVAQQQQEKHCNEVICDDSEKGPPCLFCTVHIGQ